MWSHPSHLLMMLLARLKMLTISLSQQHCGIFVASRTMMHTRPQICERWFMCERRMFLCASEFNDFIVVVALCTSCCTTVERNIQEHIDTKPPALRIYGSSVHQMRIPEKASRCCRRRRALMLWTLAGAGAAVFGWITSCGLSFEERHQRREKESRSHHLDSWAHIVCVVSVLLPMFWTNCVVYAFLTFVWCKCGALVWKQGLHRIG